MNRLPLTYGNMMASSTDAANASMRKAGRKAWNEQDRDAAQDVIDRLAPYVLADQFGITLDAARSVIARSAA